MSENQENQENQEVEFTYTITKKISKKDLENIIIDGIETGIGYWAFLHNDTEDFKQYNGKEMCVSEMVADLILKRKDVYFSDKFEEDEKEKYPLNLEKLLNGIQQNANERPWDCDLDNSDAETVDCIFQYALFGDIIYG